MQSVYLFYENKTWQVASSKLWQKQCTQLRKVLIRLPMKKSGYLGHCKGERLPRTKLFFAQSSGGCVLINSVSLVWRLRCLMRVRKTNARQFCWSLWPEALRLKRWEIWRNLLSTNCQVFRMRSKIMSQMLAPLNTPFLCSGALDKRDLVLWKVDFWVSSCTGVFIPD